MTMMLITRIILIVTIFANIALAAAILRTGLKKRLSQILTIHILGIVGWALFILFNMWMPDFTGKWEYIAGDIGYWFEKILFASAVIVASTSYWFVQYFTKNRFEPSLLNYFMLLFQILIVGASFIDNLFYTKIMVQPQGYSLLVIQPLSLIFSIFVFSHILAALFILFKASRRKTDYPMKAQLKVLFTIYVLFLLISVTTNWILPVYFQIFTFNAFGPTISLVVVGGIVYAITRYQFLDIRIVIQRGIIYTSLLGTVIGFYLATVFLLGLLFQRTTNITILLSAGLTVLIGIFGVPPLERYFRRVTDRVFFKDKYNYSQALQELSEILNKTIEVEQIVEKTSGKLKQILKVGTIKFVLGDNETLKLAPSDTPNATPILLEDKVVGVLKMGEKLSGDPYTTEDRNLLRTFSFQAAVALEKAKLYEKLKDYSRELEERVKQRTAQIQQLQEEQKQMMVDISHGLQTPLTVLKGELDLVQKQTADYARFGTLEKSIDEISKFIYDLLNLAQLETTQEDFTKEQVAFSDLLNDLVEYIKVLARDKSIVLVSDVEPGIVISGDKDKLTELVTNLVSNAIKYISNERKVSISLRKRDAGIELVIEDTGIGIQKEDLPHIFDRFYRVKDLRHSGIKGTGLGLAISKKIVERHSGVIEVESEFGKGTKFTVRFRV